MSFDGFRNALGAVFSFPEIVILGPFPTIFRLSQNHWTFPNAALVAHVLSSRGAKHSPPDWAL